MSCVLPTLCEVSEEMNARLCHVLNVEAEPMWALAGREKVNRRDGSTLAADALPVSELQEVWQVLAPEKKRAGDTALSRPWVGLVRQNVVRTPHETADLRIGLDPVSWTSFQRGIRCPDQWPTHRSGERAASSPTSLKRVPCV
jgi:hypothetical protein